MPGTTFASGNWSGYDEQSGTAPGATLTDFTLLIDISTLSATWKSNVQSDGADIRITKGDGTTELPFDLIDWTYNAGAPTGAIRCKWSSTMSAAPTVRIWAGYTGGTAVAYEATETYGSDNAYASHWLAYWHDGGSTDRTANGADLTQAGSTLAGTIKGFPATDYPGGATNYGHSSAVSLSGRSEASLLGWVSPDVTVASMSSFGQWGSSSSSQIALVTIQISNEVLCGIRSSGSAVYPSSTGTISDGSEAMIGMTHKTGEQRIYIDGAIDGTATMAGSLNTSATEQMTVGAQSHNTTPTGYFNGKISMVQAHSTSLTTDWIAEEYAQVNSQSTFWGTWAWTAASGGTIIPQIMHHRKLMGVS